MKRTLIDVDITSHLKHAYNKGIEDAIYILKENNCVSDEEIMELLKKKMMVV